MNIYNDEERLRKIQSVNNNFFEIIKDNFIDRNSIIDLLRKNGQLLKFLNFDLKNDKEIVLAAVSNNGDALLYAGENLKNDKEIALNSVKNSAKSYYYIGDTLKNDKEIAIEAIRNNSDVYNILDKNLKYDIEVAKEYIKNRGSIHKIPEELYKNREIAVELIKRDSFYFDKLNDSLKSDINFIYEVLNEKNFSILEYLNEEMKDNKELALYAVNINGNSLEYFNSNIRDDKYVVIAALNNKNFDSDNLSFVSDRLINDEDVMRTALCPKFASEALKNDRNFVLKCVSKHRDYLSWFDEKFKDDDEIVLKAIENNGNALEYASKRLINNKNILIKSINNGLRYEKIRNDLNDDLKNDKDVILATVNKIDLRFFDYDWKDLFENLNDDVKNDKSFIMKCININPGFISFVSEKMINDKDIALLVAEKDGHLLDLGYLGDEISKDPDVVLAAKKSKMSMNIHGEIFEDDLYEYKYNFEYKIINFKNDTNYDIPPIIQKEKIDIEYLIEQKCIKDVVYENDLIEWSKIYDSLYPFITPQFEPNISKPLFLPINIEGWGVKLKDSINLNNVKIHQPLIEIKGKPVISYSSLFSNVFMEEFEINNWDTSLILLASGLFYNSKIKRLTIKNLDLRNSIINNSFFRNCCIEKLTLENIEFGSSYLESFFRDCNIGEIELINFDTSKVENFSIMFANSKINKIDFSQINTSSAISMNSMFLGTKLDKIDFNIFDTSKVKYMRYLFQNSIINYIDLSNLNTKTVKYMTGMFSGSKINTINMFKNECSCLSDISYMFAESEISELYISDFDTSNVKYMTGIFSNFIINKLDISNFKYDNVETVNYMFAKSSINELQIDSVNIKKYPNLINAHILKNEKVNIFKNSHIGSCYIEEIESLKEMTVNQFSCFDNVYIILNGRISKYNY